MAGYHNPLNTAGNAIRKATPKPAKPAKPASGGGGLIMTGDYRAGKEFQASDFEKGEAMIANVVNQSLVAAQVFFLIGLIAFAILAIVAAIAKDLPNFILATGLAVTAAGLLWFA